MSPRTPTPVMTRVWTSALRRRLPALVVVAAASLVGLLSACGGSNASDAGTSTAPVSITTSTIPRAEVAGAPSASSSATSSSVAAAETASAPSGDVTEAIAQNIVRSNSSDDAYEYTEVEAQCVAEDFVERVGADALIDAGFTVAALDADETDDLTMRSSMADAYVTAIDVCTRLLPTLADALYAEYGDPFAVEECVKAELGERYLAEALSSDLQGRPTALSRVVTEVGRCGDRFLEPDVVVPVTGAEPEVTATLAEAIGGELLTGDQPLGDDSHTDDQAACYGETVVASVGVAQLAEYGITAETPDLFGADVLSFARSDAEKVADAWLFCTDAASRLAEDVAERNGPDALACAIESVGSDWVRQVYIEGLIAEDDSNFVTIVRALDACGAL